MQVSEFIKKLDNVKKALQDSVLVNKRINLVAGNYLVGAVKKRIFLNGLATNGTPIGKYSTKPYYQPLNSKMLVALPTGGKSKPALKGMGNYLYSMQAGKQVPITPLKAIKRSAPNFANGRPRKSMWLALGYYQFRQLVGRQGGKVKGAVTTDGVNLNLTGSLNEAFTMYIEGGSLILGFKDSLSENIAEGLERKYSKTIFGASPEEINRFTQMANTEIQRIVESIMNNTYVNS
jgi:hypothetical protein